MSHKICAYLFFSITVQELFAGPGDSLVLRMVATGTVIIVNCATIISF